MEAVFAKAKMDEMFGEMKDEMEQMKKDKNEQGLQEAQKTLQLIADMAKAKNLELARERVLKLARILKAHTQTPQILGIVTVYETPEDFLELVKIRVNSEEKTETLEGWEEKLKALVFV